MFLRLLCCQVFLAEVCSIADGSLSHAALHMRTLRSSLRTQQGMNKATLGKAVERRDSMKNFMIHSPADYNNAENVWTRNDEIPLKTAKACQRKSLSASEIARMRKRQKKAESEHLSRVRSPSKTGAKPESEKFQKTKESQLSRTKGLLRTDRQLRHLAPAFALLTNSIKEGSSEDDGHVDEGLECATPAGVAQPQSPIDVGNAMKVEDIAIQRDPTVSAMIKRAEIVLAQCKVHWSDFDLWVCFRADFNPADWEVLRPFFEELEQWVKDSLVSEAEKSSGLIPALDSGSDNTGEHAPHVAAADEKKWDWYKAATKSDVLQVIANCNELRGKSDQCALWSRYERRFCEEFEGSLEEDAVQQTRHMFPVPDDAGAELPSPDNSEENYKAVLAELKMTVQRNAAAEAAAGASRSSSTVLLSAASSDDSSLKIKFPNTGKRQRISTELLDADGNLPAHVDKRAKKEVLSDKSLPEKKDAAITTMPTLTSLIKQIEGDGAESVIEDVINEMITKVEEDNKTAAARAETAEPVSDEYSYDFEESVEEVSDEYSDAFDLESDAVNQAVDRNTLSDISDSSTDEKLFLDNLESHLNHIEKLPKEETRSSDVAHVMNMLNKFASFEAQTQKSRREAEELKLQLHVEPDNSGRMDTLSTRSSEYVSDESGDTDSEVSCLSAQVAPAPLIKEVEADAAESVVADVTEQMISTAAVDHDYSDDFETDSEEESDDYSMDFEEESEDIIEDIEICSDDSSNGFEEQSKTNDLVVNQVKDDEKTVSEDTTSAAASEKDNTQAAKAIASCGKAVKVSKASATPKPFGSTTANNGSKRKHAAFRKTTGKENCASVSTVNNKNSSKRGEKNSKGNLPKRTAKSKQRVAKQSEERQRPQQSVERSTEQSDERSNDQDDGNSNHQEPRQNQGVSNEQDKSGNFESSTAAAATKIQSFLRGRAEKKGRQETEPEKRDAAATRIQAASRRWAARKLRQATQEEQESNSEGNSAEQSPDHGAENPALEEKHADAAATKIQSAFRGFASRKESTEDTEEQSEGHSGEEQQSQQSEEGTTEQSESTPESDREAAVTRIQSVFRGRAARKNNQHNETEHETENQEEGQELPAENPDVDPVIQAGCCWCGCA